jgi:hypothetical protein
MTVSTSDAPVLSLIANEDEVLIRKTVRSICESFGEGYQRAQYDKGENIDALWRALSEAGFIALNVSEEWGGGGLGISGLALVLEECAASGNGGLTMIVSSGMAGTLLELHGTYAQKERYLRGISAGTTRFAFAITEADAGTNSHNIRTELRRAGDGYVLSGQKTYISSVGECDHVMVVARFRRDDGTLGKPCLCIIDTDAPGFSKQPIPMPYVAAESQYTLFFDDVQISTDDLLGGEESGLAVVFDGLNPERIAVAAVCTGTARRALDKATAYARERVVWNTPIGAHQAIAHPLAKAKIEMELARLMTQKAAALFDAGHPEAGEASNMAKYAAGEAAVHAVDAAIQTHGGNGLANEYGISDMWWLARLFRIAPVSAEMILNHISQHTLGLPRSY